MIRRIALVPVLALLLATTAFLRPAEAGVSETVMALAGPLAEQFGVPKAAVSTLLDGGVSLDSVTQLLLVSQSSGKGLDEVSQLYNASGKDIDKTRRDRVKPVTWITMALLVAITASAPIFGTFLTMVLVCAVLPLAWGERRLHYVLVFALSFPAAVAFVFSGILGVYFEPGLVGLSFH